ncbi:Rne/Rng family ribonuclease [bacterium]|nr:Rne/Rng family ribonuclease [bacterium]
MTSELFISSRNRDQQDIAILREGKLVELHREKGEQGFSVGDVYWGTVKKLVPGLNAAFVDVGYEKDAFLHYHDLGPQFKSLLKFASRTQKGRQGWSLQDFDRESDIDKDGKIDDVLQTGMKIPVQVAKEPISTKGPRITSEISMPGRFMVLVPFSDKVSASQKIEERSEKERLKSLAMSIRPEGFGLIIRTVAQGKTLAELESDLQNLLKRWKGMHRLLRNAKPPQAIHKELDRATSLLRDLLNDQFSAIHIDNDDTLEAVTEYLQQSDPQKLELIRPFTGRLPLFEAFGIERQIKTSFGKNVSFNRGAYLIIEHTEAMHVIDVNSGNRNASGENQEENALEINMQASEEIARQLRLRDMGGIIVVDFIDMHKPENRKKLFDKFKEDMSSDRAKHKILPPSRFGLVEITRQRVRPEMNIETREDNPDGGKETVEAPIGILDKIENAIALVTTQGKVPKIFVHTHPFVAAYLDRGFWYPSLRKAWSKKYKSIVKILPRDGFRYLEFELYNDQDVRFEI